MSLSFSSTPIIAANMRIPAARTACRRRKPQSVKDCQNFGGRGGIRTHGWLPIGGFQDRCLKPLGHSSPDRVQILRGPESSGTDPMLLPTEELCERRGGQKTKRQTCPFLPPPQPGANEDEVPPPSPATITGHVIPNPAHPRGQDLRCEPPGKQVRDGNGHLPACMWPRRCEPPDLAPLLRRLALRHIPGQHG